MTKFAENFLKQLLICSEKYLKDKKHIVYAYDLPDGLKKLGKMTIDGEPVVFFSNFKNGDIYVNYYSISIKMSKDEVRQCFKL